MGLHATEILDIVELIFYSPALLASIYVLHRHGSGKKLGWRFVVALALIRIVGAATGIAAIHDLSNTTLITVSDVMNSFGLSTLLLASIGLLSRVNDGMWGRGASQKLFGLINLPIIVGLVLSIVGSTKLFGSDASSRSEGYSFIKAGVTLLLVSWLAVLAINVQLVVKIGHVLQGERRLVYAVALGMPFLAARITYSMITAYSEGSEYFSSFSYATTATIVRGVMAVLPEMVVVVVYLAIGLVIQVLPRNAAQEGDIEPPKYNTPGQEREMQQRYSLP